MAPSTSVIELVLGMERRQRNTVLRHTTVAVRAAHMAINLRKVLAVNNPLATGLRDLTPTTSTIIVDATAGGEWLPKLLIAPVRLKRQGCKNSFKHIPRAIFP